MYSQLQIVSYLVGQARKIHEHNLLNFLIYKASLWFQSDGLQYLICPRLDYQLLFGK